MAFGVKSFINTTRGQTALRVICENRDALVVAAEMGEPPIRAVSGKMADILGDRTTNSFVGRIIREQLHPTFHPHGRKKWPRENGTESGSIYKRA